MFTGIVEEMGRVETATPSGISVRASKVMEDLSLGASINVNGACLTVTRLDQRRFDVDVVPETLRRTNLGSLEAGSSVNLERPVPAAGRLDGHVVQGHVDGTGRIESVRVDGHGASGQGGPAPGAAALRRAEGIRGGGRYQPYGCRTVTAMGSASLSYRLRETRPRWACARSATS